MKVHAPAAIREDDLEDALRGLCNHLTKIQHRAADYLAGGEADDFIDDVLELLDGPEQRRVQKAARTLLSEVHVQIALRHRY